MQHFVHSEGGFGHTNEDAVQVRPHPDSQSLLICALGDGMGGQAAGAEASRLAVDLSLHQASEWEASRLRIGDGWRKIVSNTDEQVCAALEAGYTTLVCLGVGRDYVTGASCGDSAAILWQGQNTPQILTESQKKNPPIGSGEASAMPFSVELSSREWQVLVMSDGVWKYLGWEVILDQGRRLEDWS